MLHTQRSHTQLPDEVLHSRCTPMHPEEAGVLAQKILFRKDLNQMPGKRELGSHRKQSQRGEGGGGER